MSGAAERKFAAVSHGRTLQHAWGSVGPELAAVEAEALGALRAASRGGDEKGVLRHAIALCVVEEFAERIRAKIREGERAFAMTERERNETER